MVNVKKYSVWFNGQAGWVVRSCDTWINTLVGPEHQPIMCLFSYPHISTSWLCFQLVFKANSSFVEWHWTRLNPFQGWLFSKPVAFHLPREGNLPYVNLPSVFFFFFLPSVLIMAFGIIIWGSIWKSSRNFFFLLLPHIAVVQPSAGKIFAFDVAGNGKLLPSAA